MKHTDAEQLLGGYATGTLTEAERQTLFAAALEHQDIFDALADEEALRELLADPDAKAQLLAALAPPAAPKAVPLWRRPSYLGAAAGLLVASLAGLAVLRSPQPVPAPARLAPEAVPAPKTAALSLRAEAPEAPEPRPTRKAKAALQPSQAAPPEPAAGLAASGGAVAPMERAQEAVADAQPALAQDRLAKKAEARPPAALAAVAQDKEDRTLNQGSQLAPAEAAGAVVSGLVGGVAPPTAASPRPARRAEAKALSPDPAWALQPQPDGSTRIEVKGAAEAQAVLLRRRGAEVTVLSLRPVAFGPGWTRWATTLRLVADDRLDLYLLNTPVAEPARLPETDPVDGVRIRIHPAPPR